MQFRKWKYNFLATNLRPATEYRFRAYATNAAGTTYSYWSGFVTAVGPPKLTALSPGSAPPSTRITLTGAYLTSISAVTFNGMPAANFTQVSSTTLTVVVPAGTSSGNVVVTNFKGTSNALPFTVTAAPASMQLTGLAPARNALAADRAGAIGLTFDKAVDAATAPNLRVFSSQHGGQLVRGGNAKADGATVRVQPAQRLRAGETVQVSVPPTLHSSGGQPAARHSYQFTAAVNSPTLANLVAGPALPVAAGASDVVLGDLDNDGLLELEALAFTISGYDDEGLAEGTSTFATFNNDGRGNFALSKSSTGSSALFTGFSLADVDNDSKLDEILYATPNGFMAAVNPRTNLVSSILFKEDYLSGATMVDLDGDGDLDALATGFSGKVLTRFNDGTGRFGSNSSVPMSGLLYGLAAADVDGDGDPDIVAASYDTNKVSIRLNDGLGNFTGTTEVPVGASPANPVLADVDGDGDLDLLVPGTGGSSVSLRLNDGHGNFSGSTEVPVGNSPFSIALADMDGDGDLDLLAANSGGTTVSLRLNNGRGAFSGDTEIKVGKAPMRVVTADVDNDGDLDAAVVNKEDGTVTVLYNRMPAPTLTKLTPANGPVGTTVVLTGTGFNESSTVSFNGTAATSVTVSSATSITAVVPAGATTGNVTVTTTDGTSATSAATVFTVAASVQDLIISGGTLNSPVIVPAGTYSSITVTGTGYAALGGAVVVNTGLTVSSGGTLLTAYQALTGPGSFTLAAGGTLYISDNSGIMASGSSGAVQTTGTRSFSPDASYVYNGTAVQQTGAGLPSRVRNLTTTNANRVDLTTSTSVAQVLTVAGSGNLNLNGQALTLLSDASGTALVVNSSTGQVSGRTATVQRYTDPSLNAGLGYRHYSSPVTGNAFSDLAAPGFVPVFNPQYNDSSIPGAVKPYPTVFGYDQVRLSTATNNLSGFTKGWFAPAESDVLSAGQGYAVNIGAAPLVDFTGTLGNGEQTLTLKRGSDAAAGWALVGNPYPAPLDWSKVAAADRTGLDAAIYVVQSTSQYQGQYRSYVNGQSTTGTNNALLATAQGFFVRVAQGRSTADLTFRNSQRVTDYATAQGTSFQRQLADERPALRLRLTGGGYTDGWVAYAQAEATAGFDGEYDAAKLPNPSGLNLSSGASEHLAIDGQPAFTAATVLPLQVGVPAAGRYTLAAEALANLPAGLTAYLRDAATGREQALGTGGSYGFDVSASEATALLTGRFTLAFAPAQALAATPAALGQGVRVYPNPARAFTTLRVPAVAGATSVQVELRDVLGQLVLAQTAALPATGASLTVPTSGLAPGVYVLRLSAGAATATKRLTVE